MSTTMRTHVIVKSPVGTDKYPSTHFRIPIYYIVHMYYIRVRCACSLLYIYNICTYDGILSSTFFRPSLYLCTRDSTQRAHAKCYYTLSRRNFRPFLSILALTCCKPGVVNHEVRTRAHVCT